MKKGIIEMSENKPDFEKLYNELSQKYSDVLSKLETYELKVIPKFNVGQTIYAIHPSNENPLELVVDSVEITKLGIFYNEFVDEKTMKHMPELFCYDNLTEAKENLENLKNNKDLLNLMANQNMKK